MPATAIRSPEVDYGSQPAAVHGLRPWAAQDSVIVKYQVVLPGRPPGTVAAAARAMAEAFNISEPKATALLSRTPGVLTKPIDEREAVRVAYKLRRIGLPVDVRPVDAEPAGGTGNDGGGSRTRPPEGGPDPRASTSGDSAGDSSAPSSSRRTQRSPFLSQVDEAPPPIPGVDDVASTRSGATRAEPAQPARTESPVSESQATPTQAPQTQSPKANAPQTQPPASEPGPSQPGPPTEHQPPEATQPARTDVATRSTEAPSTRAGARSPTPMPSPYAPTPAEGEPPARGASGRHGAASPFGRRLILAAVLPGLVALIGAWLVYAIVPANTPDDALAGITASSAELLDVVLGGRDPASAGPRAEMREALLGMQEALRARGVTLMAVASFDGRTLAGWQGDSETLGTNQQDTNDPSAALSPQTTGLTSLLARAETTPEPVLGEIGEGAESLRISVSAVRVRGSAVAAVIAGTDPTPPLGRVGVSLLAGLVLLALGAATVWISSRPVLRDHARLQEETVRISRGDLGRPVDPSERFPDTVQALERIRVSLQEGLERLRRRKR